MQENFGLSIINVHEVAELPDFSWNKIPKSKNISKQEIPNYQIIYQIAIKYS
jgi:hypothetical protein